jgi:thioredoxin-related protein
MKQILSLVTLVFGVFVFSQTGIKFEESNFKTILEKAKKENKLIFLDAFTTWCGPCKLMAKNIFPLQTVGDYYNANFVNAKIDMEKGEGIEIAKKYKVQAYPTYLFIDGDGKEVHRTLGYVLEKDFIQFGKDALNPESRISTLLKRFDDGEKDPEFLKSLAEKTMYGDKEVFSKILTRYIEVNKGKDLTKDDVNLILMSMSSSDDPTYKIFKENKSAIEKVITPQNYTSFNNDLVLAKIFRDSYNKTTKTLDEKLYLTKAEELLSKEEAKNALITAKGRVALGNKDIPTWQKLMLEKYKDTSKADAMELNEVAWKFFENVNDKAALEKAIVWAQESVKKQEGYYNTDTLANLYFKVGDKQNAKTWAQKAIDLAKVKGEDSSSTQKLLENIK